MIKQVCWKILLNVTGYGYFDKLNQIESFKNNGSFEKLQTKYLTRLLLHAYNNVEYYKPLLDKTGVVKQGAINLQQFSKLPIMTKEVLKTNFDQLISKDITTRDWYNNSTGGSTGVPTKFIHDREYAKWSNVANAFYFKHFLNMNDISSRKVILWGSDKDLFQGTIGWKAKILNFLTNTTLLNSFKMQNEDLKTYLYKINKYKPNIIKGYAGSLYEFGRYLERTKGQIHKTKAIISEAENLTPEMRKSIESNFGAKVYNNYGSREAGPIAGECKNGNLHIFSFRHFIEIVDREGNPAKYGRVIITNLQNYSMPFIRYEIGDMAEIGPKNCSCGNPFPTLKRVVGRITDHFLLKDGTTVPAEFFIHLIGVVDKNLPIKKFQVIQEEYEKIRVVYVAERQLLPEDVNETEKKIRVVMGNQCKIIWERKKIIEKTTSGKFIYTKSLLWK